MFRLRLKIHFILGTRPEAIKLAPVIRRLREQPQEFETRVIVTAQHRDLLDQALQAFAISPDYDLDIMRPDQSLLESTSQIMGALERLFLKEDPDLLLVQGDTTTTLCGALSGFYNRIPVGHVEAGLRSGDLAQPFPEEMNRILVGRLATLHFASTPGAADNLLCEGVDAKHIFVTGNTGIDALLETRNALASGQLNVEHLPDIDPRKKLIVVTAHRRESFEGGLEGICRALSTLALRDDVEIVFPVHPNPHVRNIVNRSLRGSTGIRLIEPLPYPAFVNLISRAYVLLTDSGGIQEEGPSLGKPVLVMRQSTERSEAIVAGTARLTGTDPDRIVAESALLLDNPVEYLHRSRVANPFGDGRASARIREVIRTRFARS
jgi:UDP-N-acetylglucosamine 2-epimerase (non-hydrolysing)